MQEIIENLASLATHIVNIFFQGTAATVKRLTTIQTNIMHSNKPA